jgi:hypothetical protein
VVLGAAGVTGLVAAQCVPLDRPGIGWALTGTAATGVLVAAIVAGPRAQRRDGGAVGKQALWAAATVALLAVGAVRAAEWLFALCLLTAVVTGSLALTSGHSVRALAARAVAGPMAVLRAGPWGAAGVGALFRRRERATTSARTAAAAAVSVALLVVFGALFASADAAFADLLTRVTPEVQAATGVRWLFLFTFAAAGLVGAAYLLAAPPDLADLELPATNRLRRVEWVLPLATLNAVFTGFVLVQLTVLFGGAGHVLGPAGPDFAEYARGGFWQLLVVTALTLAVLAAAARWAPREQPTDRVLIRALLGGLAALSLVIVASALYRMHTYEQAYGFTRLRVLVSVCELWLGLVLAMVLAAGVRLRAGWLPEAVVASAVAALLGLGAANPDGFIADRNVRRLAATGQVDTGYLAGLSADAVPALARLPQQPRDCAFREIRADLARRPDRWWEWNLGRSRARAVLADEPPPAAAALSCPPSRPGF